MLDPAPRASSTAGCARRPGTASLRHVLVVQGGMCAEAAHIVTVLWSLVVYQLHWGPNPCAGRSVRKRQIRDGVQSSTHGGGGLQACCMLIIIFSPHGCKYTTMNSHGHCMCRAATSIVKCLEGAHYVDVCPRSLHVQSSDIFKCLEGTHFVDVCQRSLHVQNSDILECLEATHFVDVCQRSLHVQNSDILECLEATHFVDVCQRSLHHGSSVIWS